MLVKDKLNGLFTEIEKINKLSFFDSFSSSLIDKLFILKCGNKLVTEIIEQTPLDEIAKTIVDFYGVKWENTLLQYARSVTELQEYSEILTENITNNGVNNFTRENTNKVSAFNDDDFVDDKNETETQNTNTENTHTRTQTLNKIRDTKEYENLITYLQNDLISGIIFTDVNSICTLSIYE